MEQWKVLNQGVVWAITFRLIAELVRRHEPRQELRIQQYYPGLSPLGGVMVWWGNVGSYKVPSLASDHFAIRFELGGGSLGQLSFETPEPQGAEAATARESWTADSNYVRRYLSVEDPRNIVDSIETSAGFPATKLVPPSTRKTLTLRVVASLLERRALAREWLRVSSGYLDHSGYVGCVGVVPPWYRSKMQEDGKLPLKDALRLLIVHRSANEWNGPIEGNEDRYPPGVVLDLAKGLAVSLTGQGETIDLMEAYKASGRNLIAVVNRVEELLTTA